MSEHNKIEQGDNVSRQKAQQDSTYVDRTSSVPPIGKIIKTDSNSGTVTYVGTDGKTYTVDQNRLEP